MRNQREVPYLRKMPQNKCDMVLYSQQKFVRNQLGAVTFADGKEDEEEEGSPMTTGASESHRVMGIDWPRMN